MYKPIETKQQQQQNNVKTLQIAQNTFLKNGFSALRLFIVNCRKLLVKLYELDMRFPTMWYVRPAKAQTSLRIRAV